MVAAGSERAAMPIELNPDQALHLLHKVALSLVGEMRIAKMDDFTLRQLAILFTVYLETPPHTVRGLAAKLAVTKPVITRALDTMSGHDLIGRRRDESDRRNMIIQRTVKGALHVEKLGDMVAAKALLLAR